MPPVKHALLSASAAHRWMKCTAAPRFEAQLPDSTSVYAEEGSLAHSICELKVQKAYASLPAREYTRKLNKLKKDPLYDPEMEGTTDTYKSVIDEIAMSYHTQPAVNVEIQVDLSEYIPEGYGTCDCCIIGGDMLTIVDYKHGKGKLVPAEGNEQMRLYALGALNRYYLVYGDAIQKVRMTIVQPRLNNISTEILTTEELRAWGETVKPLAQEAYQGPGTFCPGDHCQFCRGRDICRARADANSALADFFDITPNPSGTGTGRSLQSLSSDEIGDLLVRAAAFDKWYKNLQEYAQKTLLEGKPIKGWKLVEGKSNRAFTDQDAAIKAVLDAGYEEAIIYERKPKSLSELEKLMGKPAFQNVLGKFVTKPRGKPTLAPESDKRTAYNEAASDFADVKDENA